MLFVFFLIALFQVQQCDLLADRLANAKIWNLRASSQALTIAAYAETVVNRSTIAHHVNYAGAYEGFQLAFEYDSLVNSFFFILQGLGVPPYNPVQLRPSFDLSTVRWISPDILRVDYNLGISAGKFSAAMPYMYEQEDFRFIEYIVFDPNSSLINTGYTYQDKGADTLFDITNGAVPLETICGLIFGACGQINPATNQSRLALAGYTDFFDCYVTLATIQAEPKICPFPIRSKRTDCYQAHASYAFFEPDVHCPHVQKVSPVCKNRCLPACANCHANASCVATYSSDFPLTKASYTPIYKCECRNGYTGDGINCAPISCTPSLIGNSNRSANVCASSIAGSNECIDNLCKCKPSFTPQPTSVTDRCGCPAPSIVRYVNKEPVCVPVGRCLTDADRYICNIQQVNHVKCRSVNNTFNTFGACQCNAGFDGGYEYPCVCKTPKRIVWSNIVDGEVCLAANECTDNNHCTSAQVCRVLPGKQIGSCASAKRSD